MHRMADQPAASDRELASSLGSDLAPQLIVRHAASFPPLALSLP
jgi:hypothetical protein